MVSVVEDFIKRPQFTKEQRIDALELLGASISTVYYDAWDDDDDRLASDAVMNDRSLKAFQYMKRGMEERFQDPSHPLLKQPMEPVEGYQNRKGNQTREELALIEGDVDAILMESLIIRERILGRDSSKLLDPIRNVALYQNDHQNFEICIGLCRHAIEINHRCNISIDWDSLTDDVDRILYKMVQSKFPSKQTFVIEVLEETIREYEKQTKKLSRELKGEMEKDLKSLLDFLLKKVQFLAKVELCEDDKNANVSAFLRKLFRLNPRDYHGNTLLHMAVNGQDTYETEFPCLETMKLLLNAGFSVNAINDNGETPLHEAAKFKLSDHNFHLLTDVLEVLLDGGAHHDFVNNDGKTVMEMAQTDEARGILSEKRTLELKCIAAKAVKQYGLSYLGLVPSTLEKFINMH